MKIKSETILVLQSFITIIQRKFGTQIKTIRSDDGQEFHMPEFYASKGITQQHTSVETPKKNSVVERKLLSLSHLLVLL